MMERLVFTNALGESVELGNRAPFSLVTVSGLGDVKAATQTQKSAYRHGSRYIGTLLEEREIDVEILIEGNNYERVSEYRSMLARIMNPALGEGILRYENDYTSVHIRTALENVPLSPDGVENRGERFQKTFIHLLCADPFFFKEKRQDDIAVWVPAFEMPFEIPESGMEFSHRTPSLITEIINEGHIATGMEIQIKALGKAKNPRIINVITQEYLKINKTMVAGEIITIDTTKGKKKAVSNVDGPIMRKLDFAPSTFLQLEVGTNLFRYDAEENTERLEVSIYHTPKLVGV
ncbi:phage tail family protein [Bacillus cereus]|uniref:phage tail family protein n=1 Tax=Bacillus cereus TaxID=1396 RepID=UPI0037FF8D9B